MSLNACTLGTVDGQPVALTGGADGFVIAVNLADGKVIRKQHMGAPVIGVTQNRSGDLLVTTRTGVQKLDVAWATTGGHTGQYNRALPVGDAKLLLSRTDHTLELLELK